MRKLFLVLLIFATLAVFFYYNPPHLRPPQSIANAQPNTQSQTETQSQTVSQTQWGVATTPTQTASVWTAPVNPQYPSEWTTTDGQKFSKVKVMSMASDAVTIMHADGVSVVNLAVLPPDLQRIFNYNPSSAQAGAINRENDESSANSDLFREKVESMVSQINETTGFYMITREEHDRLAPYKANLDQLQSQLPGYISTLEASKQKMQSDLAALDHTDSQAVDRYNAEAKQYNDYKDWVGGQISDFCSQALNYNNELKMHGTPKS